MSGFLFDVLWNIFLVYAILITTPKPFFSGVGAVLRREKEVHMKRSYSVKFSKDIYKKSVVVGDDKKKEAPMDEVEAKELENSVIQDICKLDYVNDAQLIEKGTIITVDAQEDYFPEVMNHIVNVFRKIDAQSEVKYDFGLNGI